MINSFDKTKLENSIKKITDNNELYDYLINISNNFDSHNKLYYCDDRNSIEGKYSENTENNYLQIIIDENSINMVYTRWSNSSIVKLNYQKLDDGNIRVCYEEQNNYSNSDNIVVSTVNIKKEYLYNEQKEFLYRKKYIEDKSYMLDKNGNKIIVNNVWHSNYKTEEIIIRIAEKIVIKHFNKQYLDYPNHDQDTYSICNDFKSGMYHSENIKGNFIYGYDSIAKETYNDLIETKNKIKKLSMEEK